MAATPYLHVIAIYGIRSPKLQTKPNPTSIFTANSNSNPNSNPNPSNTPTMTKPTISLAPLKYPDGSASYTSPTGDAILASVNGPIEVTRRDTQKPEEATLEVIVKPGVGASGVGERYVEGILRGVLSRVILMRDRNMARKGVVVTLVVMGTKVREERGGSVCSFGFD